MNEDIIEQLKLSKEVVGEVNPIIIDYDGKVLSGQHRKKAGWQKFHEVDTRALADKWKVTPLMAKTMFRLHLNIQRKPTSLETKGLLMNLAQELLKKGVAKEDVASELVKIVPYTKRWVLMLLPKELKKPIKVEAGKVAGEVLHQKMMVRLVSCSRCYLASSETVEYKGETLCPKCLKKAKHKPSRVQIPPAPRVTTSIIKPKETWEHRKAVRSPQKSKMEDTIIIKLAKLGLHPDTNKTFCLRSTKPDQWYAKENTAIYLDGVVHKGKEDRDTALRELLQKRHGVKVVSIAHEGDSEATENQIVQDIAEALK